MKRWDELSMKDKSDIMKVAIKNGLTTLSDIKERYNSFAEGGPDLKEGNLLAGGGPTSKPKTQYIYDVLPDLLRSKGLDIRVSSGYRPAGAVGKSGKRSWHWRHGAVDIVPRGKTTFEDIERVVATDPDIIRYMTSNGFGYLDETNRTAAGRALMAKTGATGNHFHFGKDTRARERYNQILSGKGISLDNLPQAQAVPVETSIVSPDFNFYNRAILEDPDKFLASQQVPVVEETPSSKWQELAKAYSQKELEKQESLNNLNKFNLIMGLMQPADSSQNSIFSGIPDLLSGNLYGSNIFAMGGHIYPGGGFMGLIPAVPFISLMPNNNTLNLVQAAGKGALSGAKSFIIGKGEPLREAGVTFLKNLNSKNRIDALDAVMHSTQGGEVMSTDDLIKVGIPNYFRKLTGNPMKINYTGSYLTDGITPNTKRDLVNLYLKGDSTGFEDVTDNTYYHNGPDYIKYFKNNYPNISPRTYKMYSDGIPLELDESEYNKAMNNLGKNLRIQEGSRSNADNIASYNRWYKIIDGKLYAIDSDVWDFNPKDWSWEHSEEEIVNKNGTPFILKAIRPVIKKSTLTNKQEVSLQKWHGLGGNLFYERGLSIFNNKNNQ